MNFLKKDMKIAWYCIQQSILHPRTIITNRIGNPIQIDGQPPTPWLVSVIVLVVGIISWCVAERIGISGLDEAARLMVYGPLGNMYGMTQAIKYRGGK